MKAKHHSTFYVLHLTFILLLCACSQPKNRFTFEGSIAGVNNANFYVYCEDGNSGKIDTVRVDGGSFRYERTLTEPTVLTLLYPNFTQTYIVAEPGTTITMNGDATKLGEADITGTEENELLTQFRQKIAGKSDTEARMAAADFVRSNAKTLAATAVFRRYFAAAQSPDPAVTLPLLDELRKAQPRNTSLVRLEKRLRPTLSTSVGKPLPNLTLKTLEGKEITTTSLKGRPTLIAFWASWGGFDRQLLSALSRIQKAHSGQINLLGISLDADSHECKERLRRDSLRFDVACDGLAFNSPAVVPFGLRNVPTNILTDADGRIVARDLKPQELEEHVTRLLKK